ncbi:MAG: site-2 protease family protein [Patescibacteria group bacterium]|nr:site-2 protease family protein [Patescibacteria group bacterium]
MIVAIIGFILIFSLVVLVHELGHYYFARKAGVKVEEFGFGLPPRIWGKKKGDTIISINWIPFGGFVRLYGEGDEFEDKKDAFVNKRPGQKLWVVLGGVIMNFALGFFAIMLGFWLGVPPLVTAPEAYVKDASNIQSSVIVLDVVENSAAYDIGIEPGDAILSINGVNLVDTVDLTKNLPKAVGAKVDMLIERSGEGMSLSVNLKANDEGKAELGVFADRNVEKVSYVWWKVPWFAMQETGRIIWVVFLAVAGLLAQIFSTASIPQELSGPVGIAKITADVISLGWLRVWQFIIFLSINLGMINLVPFPGLDGGRAVFAFLELIRGGKRVPGYVEQTVNTIGFMLLILLLVVVTYKDIIRLW